MAKRSNSLTGRRSSSHNTKPYDANNSFVKKVATKVTDLIPQKSWISKWFNSSQNDEDILNNTENQEEVESEEDIQKPPPLKRPCIRMDVTHPPGTFSIQPRTKSTINKTSPSKQKCLIHNEMSEPDFCKPAMAGPSGMHHVVSSTPTTQTEIRNITSQRSELNSVVTPTNNGTTSGMDDNSESSESTSGCSSLIPQINRQVAMPNASYPFSTRKRFHDDKLSFSNRTQSPRSLFLENNTRDSLSSRRPSFNASIVTNTPEHASPLSSPFYSGNITFGGANAAGLYKQRGRTLFNNSNEIQLKVPKRTSVEVKPSNTTGIDSSGMSQTAKKILEALEHFSSPITDAKKIPLKLMNNTSVVSKKRTREETTSSTRVGLRHLTRELTVPTVPDILKLRQRKKLQDTTAAARKIISSQSEPPPLQEYHLRTETSDESKYHGKLKGKSANLDEEETIQPVNLPNIPLPISSLPNFNFIPSTSSKIVDKIDTNKEETFTFASPIKITDVTKNLKSINNFTFSSPISADKQSIDKSNVSTSPVKKAEKSSTVSSNCTSSMTQNFVWSSSSTAPRPKEKVKSSNNTTCANELKSGSVMDVLCTKSDKLKSEQTNEVKDTNKDLIDNETNIISTNKDNVKFTNSSSEVQKETSTLWECSECLFKNNSSETQCFACKANKANLKNMKTDELLVSNDINKSNTTVNNNFGCEFKLANNQWECTSCFVRNKQTDSKCIACGTIKPSTKQEANATKLIKSDLKDINFSEKDWECSHCNFKNTESLSICSSCNLSKVSLLKVSQKDTSATNNTSTVINPNTDVESLNNSNLTKNETTTSLKSSKDTWECPCCMVRNDTSIDSCPCCNTSKPNTGVSTKNVALLLANGFGDKFKKPEGAWNCDTCMLQNEEKVTECVACGGLKSGVQKMDNSNTNATLNLQCNFSTPLHTGGFKFGIDKADQEKTGHVAPTNGFKFGDNQQSSSVGQFIFGIQKEEKKILSDSSKPENSAFSISGSGFGFHVNANTSNRTDTKQNSEQVEEKPISSFSFGVPNNESGSVTSDKQSLSVTSCTTLPSTFTFGVSKPIMKESHIKEEKPNAVSENIVTEISKPNVETTQSSITISTNTLPSTSQDGAKEPKSTTSFSFGVPSNTVTVNSSSSTNVISSLPSTTQSSFTFIETKSTIQTTSAPSFGQISSAPTSALSNTFTFGENKTENPSAPKTFNALPNVTSGNSLFSSISNAPTLFNTNDAKNVSTFGTEENKKPAFDINASKPSTFAIPENKLPGFGSRENKPAIFGLSDSKLPGFGNTIKTASLFNSIPQGPNAISFGVTSSTPILFGSSVTPGFSNNAAPTFTTESTPNIFGSSSKSDQNNTSSSNLFTFGTNSNQSTAQPGTGFNFSTNANPTESTQKSLFTFGSGTATPQSGNLFGNTFSSPTSTSSSGFTFNAPKPETPAFGQPTAVAPIFGTPQTGTQNQPAPSFSSTPSNTGFNFGSTAPTSSSGGFNFGTMAPASAPSTGFNFNPPSTTPTFDPNTPPKFNFTGGNAPPQFSGTPTVTQRKIKKAFRRMR